MSRPVIGTRGGTWKDKLRDLFFGMFYYAMHQQIVHTSQKYKDIVHVIILGELFGIPILGNYYSLRLIPYILDDIVKVRKVAIKDYDILELLHEGHAVH